MTRAGRGDSVYSMLTVPSDDPGTHPYSLVRSVDGALGWVSGILPYDETGQVVHDRDAAVGAVLRVLAERLDDAGAGLEHVVKTTVFLTDMSWKDAVDDGFRQTFGAPMPARSTIEVRRLPRDARIELEAVIQRGATG